jgi:hypothetical protein
MDMNDHAFTVDVGDLQMTQPGSSQPILYAVQRHGIPGEDPARLLLK